MVDTCWESKTPFQMALILMLCVAIPFMVVMIAIYILFSTVWFRSEKCSKLCNIHFNSYKEKVIVSFPIHPYIGEPDLLPTTNTYTNITNGSEAEGGQGKTTALSNLTSAQPSDENKKNTSSQMEFSKKTTRPFQQSTFSTQKEPLQKRSLHFYNNFPLAALLESIHKDESNEHRMICVMAMLSNKWALTTTYCIHSHLDQLKELVVRVCSDHWSRGGLLTSIMKVVKFRKLAAIHLGAEFNCATARVGRAREGVAVVWKGQWNRPLVKRWKWTEAQTIEVRLDEGGVGRGEWACFESGGPLLDKSGRRVLGFQIVKKCEKEFDYEKLDEEYEKWLNGVIGR